MIVSIFVTHRISGYKSNRKISWTCVSLFFRAGSKHVISKTRRRLLERPLVLAPHLFLFLGSEVVFDVERLADLLGGLALDHVRHGHARKVEKGLDVQVVRGLGMCKNKCLSVFCVSAPPLKKSGVFLGRAEGRSWFVRIRVRYCVCCTHQDELEQRGLVHLDELGVEGGFLLLLVALLLVLLGVELGVLDDLRQDLGGDVGEGDSGVRAGICDLRGGDGRFG